MSDRYDLQHRHISNVGWAALAIIIMCVSSAAVGGLLTWWLGC